jgi:hypothetical protein
VRPAILIAALAIALGLAACGSQPLEPNASAPAFSRATRSVSFTSAGITAGLPRRPPPARLRAPGVFRTSLGAGFLSCFAYRRKEPIPKGGQELAAARRRLLSEVRKQGRPFQVDASRTLKVAGSDAIEITGTQTISRQRFRTRSLHVFKGHVEYVLELLMPPASYRRTNGVVFEPMLRSLKLTGKVREDQIAKARKQIEQAVKPQGR